MPRTAEEVRRATDMLIMDAEGWRKIREQAALLRECKKSLDDALTYSDHSSSCPGAVMPRACHCWRLKARALLLRLPASESVIGKQGDSGSVDIPVSDSESKEK